VTPAFDGHSAAIDCRESGPTGSPWRSRSPLLTLGATRATWTSRIAAWPGGHVTIGATSTSGSGTARTEATRSCLARSPSPRRSIPSPGASTYYRQPHRSRCDLVSAALERRVGMSEWWIGIAAAQIIVPCTGEDHRVRCERGRVIACDHGDVDDERTLATLGATPYECIELVTAWERRRHDLRALVVGPRGGTDEIHVDPDDPRSGGVRTSRRRHRGGGGRAVAYGASPAGGGSSERSRFSRPTDADEHDVSDLIALVGLGAGFGERLVATVAAEWTTRLREGRLEVAGALPHLHAALYGRVFAALRSWLAEPKLSLELEMTGVEHPRSLARVEGTVHARCRSRSWSTSGPGTSPASKGAFASTPGRSRPPTARAGSWRRSRPTCGRPSGSNCGSAPSRALRARPVSHRQRRPPRRARRLAMRSRRRRSPLPEPARDRSGPLCRGASRAVGSAG
jgi:hypothetical protein